MQIADRFRLELMLEACDKLAELISETDREKYQLDYKVYTSVIKTIEMIGESASRISKDIQLLHPEIPWKNLVAVRNRLTHVYWDIDFDIVWNVATVQMPIVRQSIVSVLEDS
jgi:uncharacterized protein with HEPN domain